MKTRYYIGIDPDLTDNGVAIWDSKEKKITSYYTFSFWGLVKDVILSSKEDTTFVIEAGFLNKKSNYHTNLHLKDNTLIRERVAKNVGENHAIAKLLIELFKTHGYKYLVVKPQLKSGMKYNGAWTKVGRERFKKLTGITERINDDCRDAVLLVLGL